MTERVCIKCGLTKSLSDFYAHPQMRMGVDSKCKECAKLAVRINCQKNKAYYQSYERRRSMLLHRVEARAKYIKSHAGKLSKKKSIKKYIAIFPEKRKAVVKLGNAIRDGIVIKQPCGICGAINAHAHHDYSNPLVVRWLCPKHHKEEHKRLNPHQPIQEPNHARQNGH